MLAAVSSMVKIDVWIQCWWICGRLCTGEVGYYGRVVDRLMRHSAMAQVLSFVLLEGALSLDD